MEAWVFGAILTLVGLLVIRLGASQAEFGFYFPVAGLASVGVGVFVFYTSFKKWVDRLCRESNRSSKR